MLDLSPDSKPLGWALALASQSYNHFSLGQVLVTISIAPFELTLRAERSQLLGTHLGNGNTPAARPLKFANTPRAKFFGDCASKSSTTNIEVA